MNPLRRKHPGWLALFLRRRKKILPTVFVAIEEDPRLQLQRSMQANVSRTIVPSKFLPIGWEGFPSLL